MAKTLQSFHPEIVRLWKLDVSGWEIAKKFGVSKGYVYYVTRKFKLKRHRRGRRIIKEVPKDVAQIVKMRRNGNTWKDIGDKFGISRQAVQHRAGYWDKRLV